MEDQTKGTRVFRMSKQCDFFEGTCQDYFNELRRDHACFRLANKLEVHRKIFGGENDKLTVFITEEESNPAVLDLKKYLKRDCFPYVGSNLDKAWKEALFFCRWNKFNGFHRDGANKYFRDQYPNAFLFLCLPNSDMTEFYLFVSDLPDDFVPVEGIEETSFDEYKSQRNRTKLAEIKNCGTLKRVEVGQTLFMRPVEDARFWNGTRPYATGKVHSIGREYFTVHQFFDTDHTSFCEERFTIDGAECLSDGHYGYQLYESEDDCNRVIEREAKEAEVRRYFKKLLPGDGPSYDAMCKIHAILSKEGLL